MKQKKTTKEWLDSLSEEKRKAYNQKKNDREREKRADPEYRERQNRYRREYYARNVLFRELLLEKRRGEYERNQSLRDRVKKTEQYNRIKRLYGLELDTVLDMLDNQNNKCAICGTSNWGNTNSYQMMPNIDHDHKTGRVRGLLCKKCNSGLSYFYDNTHFLLNAIAYLEAHETRMIDEEAVDIEATQ